MPLTWTDFSSTRRLSAVPMCCCIKLLFSSIACSRAAQVILHHCTLLPCFCFPVSLTAFFAFSSSRERACKAAVPSVITNDPCCCKISSWRFKRFVLSKLWRASLLLSSLNYYSSNMNVSAWERSAVSCSRRVFASDISVVRDWSSACSTAVSCDTRAVPICAFQI